MEWWNNVLVIGGMGFGVSIYGGLVDVKNIKLFWQLQGGPARQHRAACT